MKTDMPPSGAHPGPGFARATVADAMHHSVLSCDPETPLITVAQLMAAERVHSVVMLLSGPDPHDRIPWSVVTDADVLRRAASASQLTAGDVASADLVLVHADEPLTQASALMARQAVTHAVVVDREHGRPIGVLSSLDVMRVLGWGRA